MPAKLSKMQYARSYVLDQPYACVISPSEGFKTGTIFPFLLEAYVHNLQKALKGEEAWKR